MARVIKPFKGVPDGQVHPRQFEPGDELRGDPWFAQLAAEGRIAPGRGEDEGSHRRYNALVPVEFLAV